MSAGLRPRWISAATKLVGPLNPGPAHKAKPVSRRSHPTSLTPPLVAAGASSRTMKIETLTVDFTDEQKRYLEGFTTGLQISRVGRGLGGGSAGKANAEPAGPDAAHIKAQDKVTASGKKLADQEKFKREEHPFDAYPRLKQQALDNAPPNPADNFRWRYYGLFYVAPAQDSYMCRLADPERHHEALAVCRPGRSRRKTVRTVLPRHHARQSAGARDSAEERGGVDRGHPGSRAVLARHRRRQHPQRHGHADGRDRSAGAAGHPRICAGVALPHPQRSLAVRAAAQVQRRLRRRRQDRGAGRHQRHRVFRGRGEGWLWRRARRLVSPGARRHHRAQGFCQIRRHHRQAGRCDQGVGCHRAHLHRSRRPHQPQQGAAEICARRDGARKVSRAGRGAARPTLHPRAAGSAGAAAGVRPHGAYRRAQAEAGGIELDRRVGAARKSYLRSDARPGKDRAGSRRRRYPADGLAEPSDPGRARRRMSSLRSPRSGRSGSRSKPRKSVPG